MLNTSSFSFFRPPATEFAGRKSGIIPPTVDMRTMAGIWKIAPISVLFSEHAVHILAINGSGCEKCERDARGARLDVRSTFESVLRQQMKPDRELYRMGSEDNFHQWR